MDVKHEPMSPWLAFTGDEEDALYDSMVETKDHANDLSDEALDPSTSYSSPSASLMWAVPDAKSEYFGTASPSEELDQSAGPTPASLSFRTDPGDSSDEMPGQDQWVPMSTQSDELVAPDGLPMTIGSTAPKFLTATPATGSAAPMGCLPLDGQVRYAGNAFLDSSQPIQGVPLAKDLMMPANGHAGLSLEFNSLAMDYHVQADNSLMASGGYYDPVPHANAHLVPFASSPSPPVVVSSAVPQLYVQDTESGRHGHIGHNMSSSAMAASGTWTAAPVDSVAPQQIRLVTTPTLTLTPTATPPLVSLPTPEEPVAAADEQPRRRLPSGRARRSPSTNHRVTRSRRKAAAAASSQRSPAYNTRRASQRQQQQPQMQAASEYADVEPGPLFRAQPAHLGTPETLDGSGSQSSSSPGETMSSPEVGMHGDVDMLYPAHPLSFLNAAASSSAPGCRMVLRPGDGGHPQHGRACGQEPLGEEENGHGTVVVSAANTTASAMQQQLEDRLRKDQFLLEHKKAGLTYKEIRRLGHFAEAESTLRGRHRTLTKPKEERVRKPEWQEMDDRLLRRAVQLLSRRRDPGRFKISWKAVADYIYEHGGSYHFGNTTCRKRWDMLSGN